MKPTWIDRGSFYEHTSKQGTESWLNARIGRINGSATGAMAGISIFKSSEKMGKIIAGIEEEVFEQKNIELMNHGKKTEPIARKWYEEHYKCDVMERGLCVPKCDYEIGASIDGDVLGTDGIIEIKCPVKMYGPILNYIDLIKNGKWKPPSNYRGHIWKTHYSQIQQCLFVLGKSWCDYIIYCTTTSQVFVQRIPFNAEYWENHYKTIKETYGKYVKPHLKLGYSITPNY